LKIKCRGISSQHGKSMQRPHENHQIYTSFWLNKKYCSFFRTPTPISIWGTSKLQGVKSYLWQLLMVCITYSVSHSVSLNGWSGVCKSWTTLKNLCSFTDF
jgi:hypothetical protein